MLTKPQDIPTTPGVYKWLDGDKRVIYVGKANNLRQRLSNYFAPLETLHPRTAAMVQTAQHLEWTIVQNETEALTLEYNWIKEFEPRYNVIFRFDDKSYPYLAITNDEFPRVFITRKRNNKKYKYYGPFPKAWAIKSTFEVLQEILQFRNCSPGVYNQARRSGSPCLLGYIGKCSAPCVGRITSEDYNANIAQLRAVLQGDIAKITNALRQKMTEFAGEQKYELAAQKRDQLDALDNVTLHNSVQYDSSVNLDVIGISGDEFEIGVHIFKVRSGIITAENAFIIDRGIDETDAIIMSDILFELYDLAQGSVAKNGVESTTDIPREICVTILPENYVILKSLLDTLRQADVNLHIAARGFKRELLASAQKNAAETLARIRKNRRSDINSRQQALEEIALALNMPNQPLRMECYDISHSQGAHQIGAMVVFEEGLPKKKDYRLFNLSGEYIKFDQSRPSAGSYIVPDDTAAIYEVLRRRLRYITERDDTKSSDKFAYTPQLLLIDGGRPQVNAAWRAVVDAGLQDQITVASLAKRLEEIFLPGIEMPVILPRNSLGMYMLQYLRDESHNFSVRSMRRRQKNATVKSKLDSVKGLGTAKQKALLKEFGSVRQILLATGSDAGRAKLLAVKGITDEIIAGLGKLQNA